jgi:hypothetical protein
MPSLRSVLSLGCDNLDGGKKGKKESLERPF